MSGRIHNRGGFMSTAFGGNRSYTGILDFTDISAKAQAHLVKVYIALCLTMLAGVLGVVVNLYTGIGGLFTSLAGIACIFWLSSDVDESNLQKRGFILLSFGALQGMSVGCLVNFALYLAPEVLVTALLGTSLLFACFAGTGLVSKQRSYLYLGGILSSGLSFLLLVSLVDIFIRSELLFDVRLYIGLALMCGFLIFDTQMIIEKAEHGSNDVCGHAAELFVDFVAIFIRVLAILLKKREKEDREKGRGSRSAGTRRY